MLLFMLAPAACGYGGAGKWMLLAGNAPAGVFAAGAVDLVSRCEMEWDENDADIFRGPRNER